MTALLLILSTPMQYVYRLKMVIFFNWNNHSAAIYKVVIQKSVNSFVACKPVNVVSRNFIRSDFASKPVCAVSGKPVKCKVDYETVFNVSSRPVFNVPSKPVKSKITCKTVLDTPSKSVKSNVAYKPVSNVRSKLVESNFPENLLAMSPSNALNLTFFVSLLVRPLVNSQIHLSGNLPVFFLILSNSFVRKSASLLSNSPDSSLN